MGCSDAYWVGLHLWVGNYLTMYFISHTVSCEIYIALKEIEYGSNVDMKEDKKK